MMKMMELIPMSLLVPEILISLTYQAYKFPKGRWNNQIVIHSELVQILDFDIDFYTSSLENANSLNILNSSGFENLVNEPIRSTSS